MTLEQRRLQELESKVIQLTDNRRKEIGSTGTGIHMGFIEEKVFTPPDLSDTTRFETLDKMRSTDPMVKASLLVITLPVRSAKWGIEPPKDENGDIDPKHQDICDFIKETLFNNPNFTWDSFLRQALKYLHYGTYLMFKLFDLVDNRMVIDKLSPRKPETIQQWNRDAKGNFESITQFAQGYDGVYHTTDIPRNRFIHFVNDQDGDDYRGESILRSAFGAWWRKQNLLRMDAIKHERYAVPTPIIKLPDGPQQEDYSTAKDIVENWRSHEKGYAVLPAGWEMDFYSPSGNVGTDIDKSIQRENYEIMTNVLAQFQLLGSTDTGARSVGELHADLFYNSIQHVAKYIAETINRELIRELVDLNFGKQEQYPKLEATKLQKVDIKTIMQELPNLVNSRILTPDLSMENQIRGVMDLQEIEEKKEQNPESEKDPKENEPKEPVKAIELTDKRYWRELTDQEKTIQIDQIDDELLRMRDKTIGKHQKYRTKIVNGLVDKGQSLLSKKLDMAQFRDELKKVEMPIKGMFAGALAKSMREVYRYGRKTAMDNLKASIDLAEIYENPKDVEKALKPLVEIATLTLEAQLLTEFTKEVARQKALGIVDTGSLRETLTRLSSNPYNRVLWEQTTQAFGLGRATEFKKNENKIDRYIRSEILDKNTCKNCRPIDGKVFTPDSPEAQELLRGPYLKCEGGDLCRGVNIAVTKG